MHRSNFLFLAVLVSLISHFPQNASAHEPIFGLGPHTIYQYGYALGTEFEKGEQGWANHLELIYGLTPDWAVTVVAPYQLAHGNRPDGFGDLIFRTKYRFYRHDMRGASSQAALHAGIKLPTGNADKHLGTGSVDYFVGASFGYESRRYYFFSGARFHRNNTFNGLNRGDGLRFNLAYGIRPWKLEYLQPDPVFILEINGRFTGRSRRDDTEISDSGGRVISLGPGLLFSYRNVMLKVGASIPILERMNNPLDHPSTEYVFGLEIHMPPIR